MGCSRRIAEQLGGESDLLGLSVRLPKMVRGLSSIVKLMEEMWRWGCGYCTVVCVLNVLQSLCVGGFVSGMVLVGGDRRSSHWGFALGGECRTLASFLTLLIK